MLRFDALGMGPVIRPAPVAVEPDRHPGQMSPGSEVQR